MNRLPFTIKPYNAADKPHLKFQVVGKVNGKRARKFFETQSDAKTYAHLRNTETMQYGAGLAIEPWLRVMAQRCQDRLAPFKKTIEDATNHFIAWLDQRESSCTITRLFKEVAEAKRLNGRDAKYLRLFPRIGNELSEKFPDKMVSDLTTPDIEDFLTTLSADKAYSGRTRNYRRQMITTALEFGRKRGYCRENAALNVERSKVIEQPVGILTPNQLGKLLAAASPKILPALAIQAFGGVRSSEILKLDWSEVDLEGGVIEVTAKNAKSAKRRVVTIQPCLREWLKRFNKRSGLVVPCCEGDMGYLYLRRLAAEAAGLAEWPQNALRHSFASYHLAHFRDAKGLALELGHTTTALIFAHYRSVVRANVAADYWNMVPFARPETMNVFAFTAEAWPWFCDVQTVKDKRCKNGEWYKAQYRPSVGGDARNVVRRFAVKADAIAYAEAQNKQRIVKELCLEQLVNVVEFKPDLDRNDSEGQHVGGVM